MQFCVFVHVQRRAAGRNYEAEKRKMRNELEETIHHPLKGIAVTVSSHNLQFISVERRSSAVECQTLNRESPGSNPPLLPFEAWAFSFSTRRPSSLNCINEYLDIETEVEM